MTDPMEPSEKTTINSFEELKSRKQELRKEMHVLGNRISTDAREILAESIKVAAVGAAALLLSKIIGAIVKSKKHGPTEEQTQAQAAEKSAENQEPEGETGQKADSSTEKTMESAVFWLKTIASGLDAARVLVREFSEMMKDDAGTDEEE